jgi:RecA-family ATPase
MKRRKHDANSIAAEHGTAALRAVMDSREQRTLNGAEMQPLPFIDLSRWDRVPPPRRQWAIAERIPLRQPTLLSGEGGIGKSLLELQRSVAHILERDWLGLLPEPGQALYFGAEDEQDEMHRRLADILTHYDARFSDLAGKLHLLSYAGQDALLGVPNRAGIIEATPLYKRLHEAVRDIRPKSITIDTSADVFGGNENDRTQTRQFVGMLRRLAMDGNSGLMLCSHPSLTGITSRSGISGSTAWHNSVRARAYLTAATTDGGEEQDPDLRELRFKKNNYGPIGEAIPVRWRNGVFVPERSASPVERAAAEAKIDDAFLQCLDIRAAQGVTVSHATGKNYAPMIFARMRESNGLKPKALEMAMERLFSANKIRIDTTGPPSRKRHAIIRA